MQKPNYQRMYDLIDAVFSTRQDPDQLQVNAEQMRKLQALHPATLSEVASDEGPLIWALLIPTTELLMVRFLSALINEKQLLEQTTVDAEFDCIYLCSVTALPEVRGQGKTKALCLSAIKAMQRDFPAKYLFVWPFTDAGKKLAQSLALECGLSLKIRLHTHS